MSDRSPGRYGLYEPETEHDACGVGFVAHIRGERSRGIVEDALELLNRLSHRAAAGKDPETGDGAGILVQLPHRFFERERLGFELPPRRQYAVGMVFLPTDAEARIACEAALEQVAADEGQRVLGWRDVPVDPSYLGRLAREGAARHPAVLRRPAPRGAQRLRAQAVRHPQAGRERRIRERALDPDGQFHVASFSSETHHLQGPAPAPAAPSLLRGPAATPTSSARWRWCTRASPPTPSPPGSWRSRSATSRTTARSTRVRGNRNWMNARRGLLQSARLGGSLEPLFPAHRPRQERLGAVRQHAGAAVPGRTLAAPRDDDDDSRGVGGQHADERRAARLLRVLPARCWSRGTGRRPSPSPTGSSSAPRWTATACAPRATSSPTTTASSSPRRRASSTCPPRRCAARAASRPGRMFLVDTAEGRILEDEEVKRDIASRWPYRRWLRAQRLHLRRAAHACPRRRALGRRGAVAAAARLRLHGRGRAAAARGPWPRAGKEPVGSHGHGHAAGGAQRPGAHRSSTTSTSSSRR